MNFINTDEFQTGNTKSPRNSLAALKLYETGQRLVKARNSPKEAQYVVYFPRFANSSGWVCVVNIRVNITCQLHVFAWRRGTQIHYR